MREVIVIPAARSGVVEFNPVPPTLPFDVAVEQNHVAALVVKATIGNNAIWRNVCK